VGTDGNINPSLNFPIEPMICVPAATAVHSLGYKGSKIAERGGFMINRKTLRLSAVLLVVGFIFYVVVGFSMPGARLTTIQRCLPYTPAAPSGQLCISASSLAWR
jgi:hypothetical protein